MAKQEHLHKLFDAHTADLNDILIEPKEIIGCPICLRVFFKDAIDQRLVNDGHVWPKDIRKMSKRAGHMQVVLCQSCNARSSPADKQMQLHEKIRTGDQSGNLYGVRLIHVQEEDGDKPLELRVAVRIIDNRTLQVTGRVYKNKRVRDSNPKDLERLLAISEKRKKVMVTMYGPRDFKPEIVPAAWITSAYLMAFYALGYRYIMQPSMQKVRDYILKSFEKSTTKMDAPKEEDFSLKIYEGEYFADPVVAMIYPPDKDKQAFIQVSFLSYEVRLPFMYEPSAMKVIMDIIENQHGERYKEQVESGKPLFFGIKCTKTVIHNCMFDWIMGAAGQDISEVNKS